MEVIFNELCQSTRNPSQAAIAKKYVAMDKILESDKDIFESSFLNCFHHTLTVLKQDRGVTLCIDMIINYIMHIREEGNGNGYEDDLVVKLLSECVSFSTAKDKAVRLRCCEYIGRLLAVLPDEIDIIDDLWDNLEGAMIERTKDKIGAVRCMALYALRRLQDPTDESNEPLQCIMKSMTMDAVADVRKAAVESIGISRLTLEAVLSRCRDVKSEVRETAFKVLTTEADVKSLSILQRNYLLKIGLNDTDNNVKTACINMIKKWFISKEGDILSLLSCLDIESYPDNGHQVISYLMDEINQYEVNEQLHNFNDLTVEKIFCLRVQAQIYLTSDRSRDLEDLLPDIVFYCELLNDYKEDEFILKELLSLCLCFDMSNEGGRKKIVQGIDIFLKEIHNYLDVSDAIMKAFYKACLCNDGEVLLRVVELIGDIMDTEEDEQLKTITCLTLISSLLRVISTGYNNPLLNTLLTEHILPAVGNTNPYIREKGLTCLSLLMLLSINGTFGDKSSLLVIFQAARCDVDKDCRIVSKQALFDLLTVASSLEQIETLEGEIIDEKAILDLLSNNVDDDFIFNDKLVALLKKFGKYEAPTIEGTSDDALMNIKKKSIKGGKIKRKVIDDDDDEEESTDDNEDINEDD